MKEEAVQKETEQDYISREADGGTNKGRRELNLVDSIKNSLTTTGQKTMEVPRSKQDR